MRIVLFERDDTSLRELGLPTMWAMRSRGESLLLADAELFLERFTPLMCARGSEVVLVDAENRRVQVRGRWARRMKSRTTRFLSPGATSAPPIRHQPAHPRA